MTQTPPHKANSPVMPAAVAPPVATSEATRWLHTSGVVPTAPDGTVATTIEEQAGEVWRTLLVLLDEADMSASDVISVTTYAVVGEELGPVMAARDAALDGHLAASTLVLVPALAQPAWLMEISVIAAR